MRQRKGSPGFSLAVAAIGVVLAVPACAQSPSRATGAQSVVAGSADDIVVATVGDQTFRMSDLERHWQEQDPASFTRMRQQVYDANRRVLEDLIGVHLLEAEAERRGVTVEALVDEEITQRLEPVTEAQMRELYEQSQEREQGITFEQLRPAIVQYLERQQPREARLRFIEELRSEAGNVNIVLAIPRAVIDIASTDPVEGPESATVEIVEFSDFQCPYCRQLAPVIKQIRAEYGDRVRVVWKDFPLPAHPDAMPAAQAARCAQDQDKFWEYHDILFGNQDRLTPDNFKQWAADIGLDAATFDACVDAATHRPLVQAGMQLGNTYGVSSTPTVYINGRLMLGALPYEDYAEVIEEEVAN